MSAPRRFVSILAVAAAIEVTHGEWSYSANDPRSTVSKVSQHQFRPEEPHLPQPLEFIHITKTGGTSIELAGAAGGMRWGVCHYGTVKRGPDRGCYSPDWDPAAFSLPPTLWKGYDWWHVPPQWLVPNPFRGANTFVVVRNPYERIVSEYYCKSGFGYKGRNPDNPQTFNRWLSKKLHYVETCIKGREPWYYGHLIPQHYYIFEGNDNQIVTHVLKYENLKADFDDLMHHYNLSPRLSPKDESDTQQKFALNGAPKVSVHDISRENMMKINEVYSRDFSLLGYIRIDPNAAGSLLRRS